MSSTMRCRTAWHIMSMIMISGMLSLSNAVLVAQIEPSGGWTDRPWRAGQLVDIRWNTTLFDGVVDVLLWDGGTTSTSTIARAVPSKKGTTVWKIPDHQRVDDRYRLIVQDSERPWRRVMSSGFIPVAPGTKAIDSSVYGSGPVMSATLYPNPARDQVHVRWTVDDAVDLRLETLTGLAVAAMALDGMATATTLPLTGIPAGIYVVTVTSRTGLGQRARLQVMK